MANQYPNSGALWTPKFPKKHDKAPDLRGDIKIDVDLLAELMAEAVEGEVTVKLDAWKRRDKDGNIMLSLKIDTYKKENVAKPASPDPWDEDFDHG